MIFAHKSVLLNECIDGLNIKPNGIYVDCTAGGGGHSSEILKKLDGGLLIDVDKDLEALAVCQKRFEGKNVKFVHSDFKNLPNILRELNITKVDGILADLGVSSYQIDNADRGFSYMAKEEKLNMKMNEESDFSAYDVVNGYSEKELYEVIKNYGEEKFAYNIAKNICKERQVQKIETCGRLVEIIDKSIPKKYGDQGHPAKRTFQAIRIEVNGELKGLAEAVKDIVFGLKKGGRLAVITFHSLEDRIIKNAFKELETDCICDKSLPICVCGKRREIELVNKKPIVAGKEEVDFNPRAKSAKLRICERV